jgi:transposase
VALKRRTFTREFKLQIIREVEADKTQAQVARDYQLSDNTISKWRRAAQYKERASAGRGHAYTDEAPVNELERMVGRFTMENDFLKSFCRNWKPRTEPGDRRNNFMNLVQKELEEGPTAERAPQSAQRGRRAFAFDYLSSPAFGWCKCVAPRGRVARADSERGPGDARLRLPTDHQRTAAPRGASQSQARFAPAAPRQSALFAAASVCAHH